MYKCVTTEKCSFTLFVFSAYIAGLLLDGKKFLCFAHHADVIKAICKTLEENKT